MFPIFPATSGDVVHVCPSAGPGGLFDVIANVLTIKTFRLRKGGTSPAIRC